MWLLSDFCKVRREWWQILKFFMEKNGKKRIRHPTCFDWECVSVFVKFLSYFYEVTLEFSGTLHVTSNNYYHYVKFNPNWQQLLIISYLQWLQVWKRRTTNIGGNVYNINPLLFWLFLIQGTRWAFWSTALIVFMMKRQW